MTYRYEPGTLYQATEQGQLYRPIASGTWYAETTPPEVVAILERYRTTRTTRLEITYGDRDTGQSWGDTETGYIGRSIGPVSIPLLIANSRSDGGPGLLDHCVVRIRTARGKHTLYQHSTYQEAPLCAAS